MKYFYMVIVVSLFLGCSGNKSLEVKDINNTKAESIVIEDLIEIPQNVEYYTKDIKNNSIFYDIQKEYEKSYFSVWNIEKPSESLEDIKWPFRYFENIETYGENLRLVDKDFFEKIYLESNFGEYNTIGKKAITLKYSNIRALPTIKPLLKDPSLAGEGFPFDYLQNSSINPNTPLYVSHYSKNKQWVYVFSSFANGWLKRSEIVFIEDKHAKVWQNAQQIVVTKEGITVYTEDREALYNTRIGMMFALIDEDEQNYTILTISSYKSNKPMFNKSIISKDIASKEILQLNKKNLNNIITEVSKTNYGWGGIYEQRDCSSTLMDLYAPFGIWLPRNSSNQGSVGKVIELSDLNNTQKIELIKKEAIPFETFLYKKGHILLYVGLHNDNIVAFHNTWGIKTISKEEEEGRVIIGKPIFSTLKLGDELKNYDEESEVLKNLKSMNIITR